MFRSQLPLRAAVFLACSDTRDQSRHRILLSCFSCIGARPLCHAIRKGHADVVKMLIAYGASTLRNERDEENLLGDAPSPLIVAIRSGRRDIVAILLEGAPPLTRGKFRGNSNICCMQLCAAKIMKFFTWCSKKGQRSIALMSCEVSRTAAQSLSEVFGHNKLNFSLTHLQVSNSLAYSM